MFSLSVLNFSLFLMYVVWTECILLLHLRFTLLYILFETRNKNITITKGDNRIDLWRGFICITRISQEFKKTRIEQELQEEKNQARTQEKKESDKKSRIQEYCLARHFLLRQARFGLHESCQKHQICFFRQESCIEGMVKESCLISKKNKNLERTVSRSSTRVTAHLKYTISKKFHPLGEPWSRNG